MPSKLVRLPALRKAANLTQEELARILGLSRSSLANYETGLREPDFDTLQKIAGYFAVTVDYLIGADEHAAEDGLSPEWRQMIATAKSRGYEPDQVLRALELLDSVVQRTKQNRDKEERQA